MLRDKIKNRLYRKFGRESLKTTIWMHTNRTTNIDELTDDELKGVYYLFFPQEKPKSRVQIVENLVTEQELKRLRSIILADAQYMGIYTPGNWTRFNQFMKHKSVLKKALNAYKKHEFTELVKQFKSMRYKFDSSRTVVGSAAWYQFLGVKPSVN